MYEQLQEQGFSKEALFQMSLVEQAGCKALWIRKKFMHYPDFLRKKPDGSYETMADRLLKRFFIREWVGFDPRSWFDIEDDNTGLPELEEYCLTKSDCGRIFSFPVTRVVDNLDQTAEYMRGNSCWCVVSGCRHYSQMTCAALCAPEYEGGLRCIAEKGKGAWFSKDGVSWKQVHIAERQPGSVMTVLHGDALDRDDRFFGYRTLLEHYTDAEVPGFQLQAVYAGLLGVALSAKGHVFFHGPIRSYDREQMALVVEEAGGMVQRYRMINGVPRLVNNDYQANCPGDCSTGIFSGEKTAVKKLVNLFTRSGFVTQSLQSFAAVR